MARLTRPRPATQEFDRITRSGLDPVPHPPRVYDERQNLSIVTCVHAPRQVKQRNLVKRDLMLRYHPDKIPARQAAGCTAILHGQCWAP